MLIFYIFDFFLKTTWLSLSKLDTKQSYGKGILNCLKKDRTTLKKGDNRKTVSKRCVS